MGQDAVKAEEPTQSDLRALWRSMWCKLGGAWHPVFVLGFVGLFILAAVAWTIAEVWFNFFDRYMATIEETIIVRAGGMFAVLAMAFFMGIGLARYWPGTHFVRLWKAAALACLGLIAGLFVYGVIRVGTGGLLMGAASEWVERPFSLMTAPFLMLILLGWWLAYSSRTGSDRICTGCNYTLDDHMRRCPECGHSLDGPWRVTVGTLPKPFTRVFVYAAIWIFLLVFLLYVPLGRQALRGSLSIIPDDRLLAAAAAKPYWSTALEYQMWSRAWDKPGDRRKLVDAMLNAPEEIFTTTHARMLLAVLLDERTPAELRRELLAMLDVSIGFSPRGHGPTLASIRGTPGLYQGMNRPYRRALEPPGIAFRIEPADGVQVDYNLPGLQATPYLRAISAPPGWHDGAFLVRTDSLSFAPLPLELLSDAPDSILFTVVLMFDIPYRFGTPAFTSGLAPASAWTSRFRTFTAIPSTPEGLPDVAPPEPMMMRFSVPVPLEDIQNYTPVPIRLEHAR